MLTISFLGKTKIKYKGVPIGETLGNKAIALICLLILNKNRYLSREKVVAYLWPDSSEDAAKYNLRFNLWQIKKNIKPDSKGELFLHVDKDCCGVNEKYLLDCDILNIINFKLDYNYSIHELLQLRELFCGDFLEGCYFNSCDEFNELILFQRINIENKKVHILKKLVEYYEDSQNYDAAIEIINEIHEIEPYDEEMALKVMRLNIAKGNRVGAINYYSNFSNRLTGNLGISPGETLKELYDEIRNHKVERTIVEKNIEPFEIVLDTFCMEGIDYFWMSDVISQILKKVKPSILYNFENKYIIDLSHIQRDILSCIEDEKSLLNMESLLYKEVPDVCVINAFIKLLKIVSEKYKIQINISNMSDMDNISQKVFVYLKREEMSGMLFNIVG
ncbi:AfsR/SARP family transcriptional regulator [Aminipila sp.]|uniref:AfsR/SARP family transcriptional regulator n=1 Tax=Aminipila sp. TaxID=2060095 RepID=UPI00289A3C4F|nr:BTAD domain-containing putative transcriptional regulator [Aminipila sp.]